MSKFVVVLILFPCLCIAQNRVTLDVSEGVTWEQVFAAGLRPQHLNGGLYMCTEYGVDLTIKTTEPNLELHLGVGDVDLKVKADHRLVHLSFYGRENRTLEEAKYKSQAFAKMFSGKITQRATLETFENKHEVGYAGEEIRPPEIESHVDIDTTTTVAKSGDTLIIYSFVDSYEDINPLAERFSVSLESKEAKRAKRLTEKIRPPVGYEHISLEPREDDEVQRNGFEAESVTQKRRRERPSKQLVENAEKQAEEGPLWLYFLAALVALTAVLFGVKARKGRSAS